MSRYVLQIFETSFFFSQAVAQAKQRGRVVSHTHTHTTRAIVYARPDRLSDRQTLSTPQGDVWCVGLYRSPLAADTIHLYTHSARTHTHTYRQADRAAHVRLLWRLPRLHPQARHTHIRRHAQTRVLIPVAAHLRNGQERACGHQKQGGSDRHVGLRQAAGRGKGLHRCRQPAVDGKRGGQRCGQHHLHPDVQPKGRCGVRPDRQPHRRQQLLHSHTGRVGAA
mmetsp:Transcript_41983/g.119143  ORF Transcript_41983/g.119143 Transcript_41983/m.119143 type:complete len:223 (+) Transcript_41983:856-1524(+)